MQKNREALGKLSEEYKHVVFLLKQRKNWKVLSLNTDYGKTNSQRPLQKQEVTSLISGSLETLWAYDLLMFFFAVAKINFPNIQMNWIHLILLNLLVLTNR